MPRDIDRPTRYRGVINLYVEDSLTLVYLKRLWNDPAIDFFLGGGNEGVATIVKVDRAAGHENVFGVIDRDYVPTNRDRWTNPGNRLFILDTHEIENDLLDSPALASSRWNNLKLSAERIEELLLEAATKRVWYEACRSVLGTIRSRFRANFIGDPPQNLTDLVAAHRHLCQSDWFLRLADHVEQTTAAAITGLLTRSHALARDQLVDGTWRREFSGKEIFQDLASRICDRQSLGGIQSRQLHEDLAQAVAAGQEGQGQTPPDLLFLHGALRSQVELI